ncbi:hypothetical protein Pcinc_007109 [Petrolisthes cinctipes]|uniref:Uncharacterized protein n=1 Tax=Petrolisthes cinctipes TaxID=88211 RepID=A0AAE1GFW4_PETCI|nr:hypothetical protein Pcinc_015645 [Petrolisthes cinctipes]KAK3888843.1 hypothetical protein Pcinc_007109 [Petrolisthes cinctipes]
MRQHSHSTLTRHPAPRANSRRLITHLLNARLRPPLNDAPNTPSTPPRQTHHHIGLPPPNTPLRTYSSRDSYATTPVALTQLLPATTRTPPLNTAHTLL